MIIPYGTRQIVQLDTSYVTDSPLSVTNTAELCSKVLFKLTTLNAYPLWDGPTSPTGEFKKSLDSFHVTDCPLSVTNITELAMF